MSNILQNILLSVFFIIVARQYTKSDFANYIIANTIYTFVLGFSTLGLGYWFIRELVNTTDKNKLLYKFFKMQLYIGVVFYLINIIISFSLYQNELIRSLSLIIGINIVFDNVIYVIKSLNIAEFQQKKTFVLLVVEAFLKLIIAVILFFYPMQLYVLAFFLIALRLITLNLFVRYGCSNTISLKKILLVEISFKEVKELIATNWSFVVIGSLSVVNWKVGNIFISKFLNLSDVANYEISFKILSLAYIIPVIVSSSIYPNLLNAYKVSVDKMKSIYYNIYFPFSIFGIISFTFIFSYADYLIPLLFGQKYHDASACCKEMFLVMLIFPTLFIQANVLMTLKLEKLDMWCNLISLLVNVTLCYFGLIFFKSVSVVNYSIFISIFCFHLAQDIILIRRKIATIKHVLIFYFSTAFIVLLYYYLNTLIIKEILFFTFWLSFGIVACCIYFYRNKNINPAK